MEYVNTQFEMAKKKAGRPTERKQDRPFHMRADDEFFAEIDAWRKRQPDQPNRTQAVRRLIAEALRKARK